MGRAGLDISARVEEQVRALVEHEAVARLGDDPEGVHQMRVAVRRLRAALKATPDTGLDPVRDELRWLGGVLGRVRDLDVLLGRIRTQSADFPPAERAAVERLLAGLVADRRRARRRLLEVFDGSRYTALLHTLTGLRVPAPRDGDALLEVIAGPHRKLRRDALALGDDPPDDDLHALRIRGKRLRYAAELAEPTGGKPVRRLIKATREFQDVLGDHQDACVAEAEIRDQLADLTELADIDHEAVFVAGRLVEREHAVRADRRARWHEAFTEVDRLAADLLSAAARPPTPPARRRP
ncbi:CHAD domain-containing protein [Actinophytocola gossypii]|uniref:CHAD domain-containing protein n=1 Tax=Actinophytocola gossypii TaxID=2812003 RepID=A0ABT2JJD0_9PSEU|nr:CHAD domain-containing protein [Actinophytocola gossypii]MCT2587500.1 CHAD domain-containing protein [Actinophytocola gossypii]